MALVHILAALKKLLTYGQACELCCTYKRQVGRTCHTTAYLKSCGEEQVVRRLNMLHGVGCLGC